MALLVEQYRRDGFVVFDNSVCHNNNNNDTRVVDALAAAVTNLTTGANREFAEAVKAVVSSGVTPNFTAGCKIPWVQYEAGTNVATGTSSSSQLAPV